MPILVKETADFAVNLIKKNGGILPFCRAKSSGGEIIIISPDDLNGASLETALESVWVELRRRLSEGKIAEFALCSDVEVKFAHKADFIRVLKIEFQDGTADTGFYFYPLSDEGGELKVGDLLVSDVTKRLL